MFTKVSKKDLNNLIIIKDIKVYFQLLASGALGLLGVYVENEFKTIFPIVNEKRGKDFHMCAFVRSAFLPLTLRLFVFRIDFFQDLIILDHRQPSTTINTIGAHQKPSGNMR